MGKGVVAKRSEDERFADEVKVCGTCFISSDEPSPLDPNTTIFKGGFWGQYDKKMVPLADASDGGTRGGEDEKSGVGASDAADAGAASGVASEAKEVVEKLICEIVHKGAHCKACTTCIRTLYQDVLGGGPMIKQKVNPKKPRTYDKAFAEQFKKDRDAVDERMVKKLRSALGEEAAADEVSDPKEELTRHQGVETKIKARGKNIVFTEASFLREYKLPYDHAAFGGKYEVEKIMLVEGDPMSVIDGILVYEGDKDVWEIDVSMKKLDDHTFKQTNSHGAFGALRGSLNRIVAGKKIEFEDVPTENQAMIAMKAQSRLQLLAPAPKAKAVKGKKKKMEIEDKECDDGRIPTSVEIRAEGLEDDESALVGCVALACRSGRTRTAVVAHEKTAEKGQDHDEMEVAEAAPALVAKQEDEVSKKAAAAEEKAKQKEMKQIAREAAAQERQKNADAAADQKKKLHEEKLKTIELKKQLKEKEKDERKRQADLAKEQKKDARRNKTPGKATGIPPPPKVTPEQKFEATCNEAIDEAETCLLNFKSVHSKPSDLEDYSKHVQKVANKLAGKKRECHKKDLWELATRIGRSQAESEFAAKVVKEVCNFLTDQPHKLNEVQMKMKEYLNAIVPADVERERLIQFCKQLPGWIKDSLQVSGQLLEVAKLKEVSVEAYEDAWVAISKACDAGEAQALFLDRSMKLVLANPKGKVGTPCIDAAFDNGTKILGGMSTVRVNLNPRVAPDLNACKVIFHFDDEKPEDLISAIEKCKNCTNSESVLNRFTYSMVGQKVLDRAEQFYLESEKGNADGANRSPTTTTRSPKKETVEEISNKVEAWESSCWESEPAEVITSLSLTHSSKEWEEVVERAKYHAEESEPSTEMKKLRLNIASFAKVALCQLSRAAVRCVADVHKQYEDCELRDLFCAMAGEHSASQGSNEENNMDSDPLETIGKIVHVSNSIDECAKKIGHQSPKEGRAYFTEDPLGVIAWSDGCLKVLKDVVNLASSAQKDSASLNEFVPELCKDEMKSTRQSKASQVHAHALLKSHPPKKLSEDDWQKCLAPEHRDNAEAVGKLCMELCKTIGSDLSTSLNENFYDKLVTTVVNIGDHEFLPDIDALGDTILAECVIAEEDIELAKSVVRANGGAKGVAEIDLKGKLNKLQVSVCRFAKEVCEIKNSTAEGCAVADERNELAVAYTEVAQSLKSDFGNMQQMKKDIAGLVNDSDSQISFGDPLTQLQEQAGRIDKRLDSGMELVRTLTVDLKERIVNTVFSSARNLHDKIKPENWRELVEEKNGSILLAQMVGNPDMQAMTFETSVLNSLMPKLTAALGKEPFTLTEDEGVKMKTAREELLKTTQYCVAQEGCKIVLKRMFPPNPLKLAQKSAMVRWYRKKMAAVLGRDKSAEPALDEWLHQRSPVIILARAIYADACSSQSSQSRCACLVQSNYC